MSSPETTYAECGLTRAEWITETPRPLLTVIVARDGQRFSACCPELDLLTEMDTADAALADLLSMMREYAEEYQADRARFCRSPNRAHHHPFIQEILRCADLWELREKVSVRFGHLHLSPIP